MRRRTFLRAAALTPLGIAFAQAPARAADPALQEVDLGTPVEGVVSPNIAYTQAPDGTPEAVFVANGQPARATVVNVATGERRFDQDLANVVASWGSETAPDGTVYIGSQSAGLLLRYVPGTGRVEPIGRAVASETHHWGIDVAPDGKVYGGTYPNGKVFGFDPTTGVFTDYGQMVPGVAYVRDVAASDDRVYAGTSPRAHLVELDPDTGSTREIPLPEAYQGQDAVYNVSLSGGLLFARVQPANVMLVYDPKAGAWIDQIPGTEAFEVPEPSLDRTTYLTTYSGLVGYDFRTRTWARVDVDWWTMTTRGAAWLPLQLTGFPGRSFVTGFFRGTLLAYNPITGNTLQLQGDVAGNPLQLSAVGTGPDGQVYVGAYLSPPGMARVDVDTGTSQLLPGISQVQGMGSSGTLLFLGVYPNANVLAYDTSGPWDPPNNPRPQIPLGQGQDRPVAFAGLSGKVAAVGSVPVSGQLGGALSFFDASNGSLTVHRNVVPDQSLVTLVARDGMLYGGTSISGGDGIAPTTTEGQLFIWDLVAGNVVYQAVPVPGQVAVASLAFDDAGILWGLAGGWLFTFDPAGRTITRSQQLFPVTQGSYWTGWALQWWQGRLFGVVGGQVFEVDTATWTPTTLAANGASYLAVDHYGSLYYARGTHLFRLDTAPRSG